MAIKTKLQDLTPSAERLKSRIPLISGGYSLKPEVPDGVITVYPWDTEISEWVLETRSGTKGGEFALTAQIAAKLTRLPSALIERFVASEIMLVMLVARSLVDGGRLTYTAQCPHCDEKQKPSSISVPNELGKIGERANDYRGWDELTLPESQDVLKVRPLLVGDMLLIADAARGMGISEAGLSNAASIVEINATKPDKPKELAEYYLALPPADVAFLRRHLRETSPTLDTAIPHRCDSEKCKKPFSFNIGFHYDFFL